MASVSIRFECGSEDRQSAVYGPFEYMQLTYDSLRTEDGVHVAQYDQETSEWHIDVDDDFEKRRPGSLAHVVFSEEDKEAWWSDIVIFSTE